MELKEKQTRILKKFPYELKPIDQLTKKLNNEVKANFLDIHFPPENSSAYK